MVTTCGVGDARWGYREMSYRLLHPACNVKRIPLAKIMNKMFRGDTAVFEGMGRVWGEDCIVIDSGSAGGLL